MKQTQARILTTVVGSYPVPSWLAGNNSRSVLRDAILTVLKTQELAGLDLVSDGELQRFDPGHPETNGMIDYFVSQMDGIRTRVSRSDLDRFRSDQDLNYRAIPAGRERTRLIPSLEPVLVPSSTATRDKLRES